MDTKDIVIKARDMVKQFGKFIANDHLNFDVYRGEVFGFLGANGAGTGPIAVSLAELKITVAGSVAYTHCVNDVTLTAKDGSKEHIVVRVTDVLRKQNGKWLIVLEHISVPVDPVTGKSDLLSKP